MLMTAAALMTSCYDDLELRQEIEGLGNEVEQIKTDIAQLKSDLAALKAAADKDLTVVELNKLADGYEIVFSDGTKAVIKNGKDGKDGLDGTNGKDGVDGTDGTDGKNAVAPVVGVAEDEDGNLYWTVDGEWLLVDGEKVRANAVDGVDGAAGKPGADAKAPVVTIALDEDGYYYWQIDGEWLLVDDEKVRANGIDGAAGEPGHNPVIGTALYQGETLCWTLDNQWVKDRDGNPIPVQGAAGLNGDAFFRSIGLSEDGTKLVMHIINPEYPDDEKKDIVYEIPMGVFNIAFVGELETTGVTSDTRKFNYTVSGVSAGEEVIVRVLSTNATEYKVVAETNTTGYVEVTLPSGEGWLDVYAINNTTGDFKAKSIKVKGTDFVLEETVSALHFSPAGDSVELPLTTGAGVEYEVEMSDNGKDWLDAESAKVKAVSYWTLTLSAEANTTDADRKTTVTIRNKDTQVEYAKFTLEQKNYYPELISVDGEQVEWEETFGYYSDEAAVTPVKVGDNQLTYTNTFTISLSDDFTRGAYKINGMFVFKHNMRGLEGGEYYADVEGAKLIVYTDDNAPSRSYYFKNKTVELTYNKSNSTLESSPIGFGTKYDNADYSNKEGWIGDYSVKVYVPAVEPEAPGDTDPISGTWDLTAGEMGTDTGFGDAPMSLAGKTMIISGSDGNYTIETINGVSYNFAVTLNGNTLSGTKNGAQLKLNYDSESNTLTQEGEFMDWTNPAIRGIVATKQGGALTASAIIENLVGVNWKQEFSSSSMVNKLYKVSFVKVDANHIKINNLFDCVTISSALIDPSAMTLTVSSGWAHPQADPSIVNPELIFNISDDFKTITLSGTHAFGGYMSVTDYVLSKES